MCNSEIWYYQDTSCGDESCERLRRDFSFAFSHAANRLLSALYRVFTRGKDSAPSASDLLLMDPEEMEQFRHSSWLSDAILDKAEEEADKKEDQAFTLLHRIYEGKLVRKKNHRSSRQFDLQKWTSMFRPPLAICSTPTRPASAAAA